MFDPQQVTFVGTMCMCLSHKSGANAVGEEYPVWKGVLLGKEFSS